MFLNLYNKHAVPKTVKPVAGPFGLFIGIQYPLAPGKCTHHYKKGRTGQMKIGYHAVHYPEIVSGVNIE